MLARDLHVKRRFFKSPVGRCMKMRRNNSTGSTFNIGFGASIHNDIQSRRNDEGARNGKSTVDSCVWAN